MKTTTTTTITRRVPRSKRPAHLERATSLFATTSRGMLSFLARLSGRRRRWRHVRRARSPSSLMPGAAAAGACNEPRQTHTTEPPPALRQANSSSSSSSSSMEEADEASCARCRAHSCCSCELLGLREQPGESLRRPEQAHCRQSRYRSSSATESSPSQQQQQPSSNSSPPLLRRRPPEARTSCSRTSYLAATLLILSTGLISVAEACSSRSTPKPRPPTPTPRPNITFHMYTCPPDYAEWYCLNGATCFTVKIVDSLLYNCLCANGYIGQRCEFKDLEGSYMPKRHRIMLETASIAGAVTIAVFLAVITFISIYIHCKRKQKELRMMSNGNGVDVVDGSPPRDPELRPFCSRSRSLMIFMAKNPNSSATPPIEQTRMPSWNYPPSCPVEASTRMTNVNESKRPSQ